MKLVPAAQLAGKQFKLVESNYEAIQVPEITGAMEKQTLLANGGEDIEIKKNGYLYVYVSNASKGNVYFDELSVVHTRGPLLEETHYYPFGLTMSGISSKALAFGEPENKKKYNGIEKEDDLQIEVYDAQFRELDGQTGRWWQVDPKTENMEMWSPYASNYDNPIIYEDLLGDEPDDCCGWFIDGIIDGTRQVLISASGVTNGLLNTASLGIVSSDPFNFRRKLNQDELELYDNSVLVGKIAPLLMPGVGARSPRNPSVQLAPAGPVKPVPIVVEKPIPIVVTPNSTSGPDNEKKNRSASDNKLIEEARLKKAKEDAAKKRQQNKENATQRGNERTGQSNQQVRGEHENTQNGGGTTKRNKHENANARRKREQDAADKKK